MKTCAADMPLGGLSHAVFTRDGFLCSCSVLAAPSCGEKTLEDLSAESGIFRAEMVGSLFVGESTGQPRQLDHCRSCCICMAAVTFTGCPSNSAQSSRTSSRQNHAS